MTHLLLLAALAAPAAGSPAPVMPAHAFDYGDPPIAALHAAALARAGLDPDALDAMLSRARWSDALPDVRLRVVRDADRDGRTTVRFTGERGYGDLAAVEDRGDGLQLLGELRWSLGALVHGKQALAVAREQRAADKTRRALLDAITAAYFARRRAVLSLATASDAAEHLDARLRRDEAAATLDALTGGVFSRLSASTEDLR